MTLYALVCAALIAAGVNDAGNPVSVPVEAKPASTALCDALDAIQPFETKQVVVRGIIGQGPESTVIYDPACPRNVQPVAAIEIGPNTTGWPKLQKILNKQDASVVVEGVLHGPRCVRYRQGMPPEQFAEWMSPCARYSMNSFRLMLFVTRVISVESTNLVHVPFWQPSTRAFPMVEGGEMPRYPPAARVLEIAGTVEAEVTVERGEGRDIKILSGDPMLAAETLRVLKTWKFDRSVDTTFRTTFTFELKEREIADNQNARVYMELPSQVRIVATVNKW